MQGSLGCSDNFRTLHTFQRADEGVYKVHLEPCPQAENSARRLGCVSPGNASSQEILFIGFLGFLFKQTRSLQTL